MRRILNVFAIGNQACLEKGFPKERSGLEKCRALVRSQGKGVGWAVATAPRAHRIVRLIDPGLLWTLCPWDRDYAEKEKAVSPGAPPLCLRSSPEGPTCEKLGNLFSGVGETGGKVWPVDHGQQNENSKQAVGVILDSGA